MTNKDFAPICLFVYNRLEQTKQTVESLQKNFLAGESELFIFSDGAKNENTVEKVKQVRAYIKTITGFKSVTIFESENNKGLANSIISGVTKIIEQYGKIIVVEDDLILTENFLDFLNQSLCVYENMHNIFSVSGFSHKVNIPHNFTFDNYFYGRSSSWGWGTWQDRWKTVDWEIKDWYAFSKNKVLVHQFKKYGSDTFSMLKNSILGKNNSWAIRFYYAQFRQQKLNVYPVKSKVINNGFQSNSTHCNVYDRFEVILDQSNQTIFKFDSVVKEIQHINRQIYSYYSLRTRITSKIKTLLMKKKWIKQQSYSYVKKY